MDRATFAMDKLREASKGASMPREMILSGAELNTFCGQVIFDAGAQYWVNSVIDTITEK